MNFPNDLMYTKSHEWIKMQEDGTALVGLSDYAQDALGDLVFVNLSAGEPFADVESVKAVSDVYSPLTGVVDAINDNLLDTPEAINEAPYDAWFIKVSDITDKEELMDAGAYEAFLKTIEE